jgi:hypothetical protein
MTDSQSGQTVVSDACPAVIFLWVVTALPPYMCFLPASPKELTKAASPLDWLSNYAKLMRIKTLKFPGSPVFTSSACFKDDLRLLSRAATLPAASGDAR